MTAEAIRDAESAPRSSVSLARSRRELSVNKGESDMMWSDWLEKKPLTFDRPPIRLPVATTVLHKDSAATIVDSNAWASVALRGAFTSDEDTQNFILGEHGTWACYAFSDAAPDRIRDLADAGQYLFVADDKFADAGGLAFDVAGAQAAFDQIVAVLNGESTDDGIGCGQALAEVWSRFQARSTTTWQERFVTELSRFVRYCVEENKMRVEHTRLTVEDYMGLRFGDICADGVFLMGEYGLGIDLTHIRPRRPELREIDDVATEHLILVNDLFSFRKEYFRKDSISILGLLCDTEKLSLQEAINWVANEIEVKAKKFDSLQTRILATPVTTQDDADVHAYVRELAHIMYATAYWSHFCGRYHGPGFSWNNPLHGTVTLHPDRTTIT